MNFYRWLTRQIDRDDPIGVFARNEEQMEVMDYAYREWRYAWRMGTRVPEITVDWWSDAELEESDQELLDKQWHKESDEGTTFGARTIQKES